MVAGLFGVVGVGAAVAMVITGDEVTGGKATAQALAEATVAAWAAGDGDRAVGLMPSYDELAAVIDCPRIDDDAGRARHQRHRAEVWAKARVWKPRRPHLRQVAPGEVLTRGVDEEMGRCRAEAPLALQTVEVTVELDGRGHGQYEVTLTAVQLGQRWYLMDAGDLPPGLSDRYEAVLAQRRARERRNQRKSHSDHDFSDDDDDDDKDDDDSVWVAIGGTTPETRRELRELRELRDRACACTDTACIDEVQLELAAFSARPDDDPALPQQGEAIKLGLEMTECTSKVRAAARLHTGVPACDEYIAIIEWYSQCDAIPQASRDAMRQGIDAMQQGWADAATLPDSARQSIGDSCRAAVDALRQAGDAMGCGPLPSP